jgi:hypothetical protein
MSRADVKEFGEVIDEGTAALVVVGESKIEPARRSRSSRLPSMARSAIMNRAQPSRRHNHSA